MSAYRKVTYRKLYEVNAYGVRGNGLAFEHDAHMLDRGWQREFTDLTEALAFIATRKSA